MLFPSGSAYRLLTRRPRCTTVSQQRYSHPGVRLFDRIDPRSPTPLYEQIASRLRVAIASGELSTGAGLPSVRQLAAQLRINPATVVQAYRELESEGFVKTRHGAGTFVSDVEPQKRTQERSEEARRLVREMIAAASRLGLTPTDLAAALKAELDGATA